MKLKALSAIKILRASGILIFLILISFISETGDLPKSFYENRILLNPECKIKRMSNGEVMVIAKNQEGMEVGYKFTDLYADLLMAAYRKQRMVFIVENISKKYYLSKDDCRREIKHAINILADWNIVLREEQVALQ
jgi:hypothetical protein